VNQGKLPHPWTEFIGRDRERASLKRLLGRARLVTILGLSGVGKSRLARQVIEDLRPEHDGELWFVPCDNLEGAEAVLPALAAATGLTATRWETLVPQLAGRRALLFLDTAECLLTQGLQEQLRLVLEHTEAVTVVLTSQVAAGLDGEHLFPLRPMFPAPPDDGDDSAAAREADAVRLFEARAQQRDCEWALTLANRATVVALCQEMDWLPLGIELVAGQLSPWTEDQLLEQIRERGTHLDLSSVGGAARHASMRRAIAWSWSMLPPVERALVALLAAMDGQAFEEALGPLTGDPQATVVAASLYRKGVLQAEQRAGRLRYVLPGSVCRFAMDQQPAPQLDLHRAAPFYLDLARREGARLSTPAAAQAAEALRLETPMLLHCWKLARDEGDGELLRGFVGALGPLLLHELELPAAATELTAAALHHLPQSPEEAAALLWIAGTVAARLGPLDGAVVRLRACLEPDVPEMVRALALKELGRLQLQQGQPLAARDGLQQGVASLLRLDREEEVAWTRRTLAMAYEHLGDRHGAERLLEEARLQFAELEVPAGQACACVDLARLAADEGRWEVAEARSLEGARRYQDLGHVSGLGGAQLQLARVRAHQGELEDAQRLYEEALRLLRSSSSTVDLCHGLLQTAVETLPGVRPIEPTRAYRECISLTRERGMRSLLAHALRGLAATYATDGRDERALALAQEAVQVARETTETPLIQACLELLGQLQKPSGPGQGQPPYLRTHPGLVHVEALTIRERETATGHRPLGVRRATVTAKTVRGRSSNWPPVTPSPTATPDAAGPMQVRLLGGMSLFLGDQEVPLLEWWAKAKKLFAYLVIHRGRPISRDILLEEFWPDGDQQRAIHSLQTTLSFLRRSLRSLPGGSTIADRLIIARDGNYLFDSDGRCESDLQEFEHHCHEGSRLKAAGQLEEAAMHWMAGDRLYVGDLLPDFPYEDWCASPRERLRSQYLELLLDLARYQRQSQKPREALRTTERMFAIDACDERAHRMAMRCHVQLGRPVDALRQYERCCQVLDRELRVQPSKATRDLHELIRHRMAARDPRPSDSSGDALSIGA
jgi:DNA-binding SARP family transcriptional activator/predicted ATPase